VSQGSLITVVMGRNGKRKYYSWLNSDRNSENWNDVINFSSKPQSTGIPEILFSGIEPGIDVHLP
jgi:hypothetical protein